MKKQYKLNIETFSYELIKHPRRVNIYLFVKRILIFCIIASLLNLVFVLFFHTPKLQAIEAEKNKLVMQYDILQDKIAAQSARLGQIKHRDNTIYRNLFGIDTLNIEGIYVPYLADKYSFENLGENSSLASSAWHNLDQLTRSAYLQSKSLDELQVLSKDKEKIATAIPAIWPIDKRAYRGALGLYGYRNHPILHRYIMHKGIDFGAPTGTAIYASGDGVVLKNPPGYGYGKHVLIDHGFGYKTRYAHMSKILVEVGQKVKRGETIGLVGSTGRSTGPHLHYEVIFHDKHVDPLNYFRRDMNTDEFERIIEAAQTTTYEKID